MISLYNCRCVGGKLYLIERGYSGKWNIKFGQVEAGKIQAWLHRCNPFFDLNLRNFKKKRLHVGPSWIGGGMARNGFDTF